MSAFWLARSNERFLIGQKLGGFPFHSITKAVDEVGFEENDWKDTKLSINFSSSRAATCQLQHPHHFTTVTRKEVFRIGLRCRSGPQHKAGVVETTIYQQCRFAQQFRNRKILQPWHVVRDESEAHSRKTKQHRYITMSSRQ